VIPYGEELEKIRSSLLTNDLPLPLEQIGAGSRKYLGKQDTVALMARSSLSSWEQQTFLYRLVAKYQPDTMLELGTSFGISALCQQLGNIKAKFISIEGRRFIHQIASDVHARFPNPEIQPELWCGTFDSLLPEALENLQQLDYLFIDGDHRYAHLLEYYKQCAPYLRPSSVVVIHDIYWSEGMTKAWHEISHRPEVSVAIDLFHSGILFYQNEIREPIRVSIVSTKWKPHLMGFFR